MKCPKCGSNSFDTLKIGFMDVEKNLYSHKCLKCGALFEKKENSNVSIDKEVLME